MLGGSSMGGLAALYEKQSKPKEAIAEYEIAIALNDDPLPLALLGRLYGRIGRKDEALKILNRLRDVAKERYVSKYDFAVIQMGLGQKDQAIRLLEEAYEDHNGYDIAFIKTDRLLSPLHNKPRFQALVQKVFAPKEAAAASEGSP
jgi:tetratricopeptide (TPR) repeat protein